MQNGITFDREGSTQFEYSPTMMKSILKKDYNVTPGEDTETLLQNTSNDCESFQWGKSEKSPTNNTQSSDVPESNLPAIYDNGNQEESLPVRLHSDANTLPLSSPLNSACGTPLTDRLDDYSIFDSSENRGEDDLEFSDSVASPLKGNCWGRDRDSGNSWQNNDTSPSDNFDVEESMVGSVSIERSPSDDNSLSSHNLMHLSPVENNSNSDPKLAQTSFEFYTEGDINGQRKDYQVDTLLNNIGRMSSDDSAEIYSQEASG